MKGSLLIVSVAAAVVTGFGAGWILRPDAAPSSAPDGDAALTAELREEVGRLQRALEEARSVGLGPGAEASEPPETDDPGLAGRAEKIRRDALARAKNAERIAAVQIAAEEAAEKRRAEEERRRLQDEARGGTMGLIRSLAKDWVSPWDLLGSAEEFGKHFTRRTEGPFRDGTDLRAPAPDGATLSFAAGRHEFGARHMKNWKPFPKDILVMGQGMNETLLVMDSELDARGDVANLGFQDLTIHTDNEYLECFRNGAYALRLVRCRVIGFDNGAAGGDMLSGSTGAFYASDCRFESGFGSSPGRGMLFDVRGALLARLERCTIRGPLYTVFNGSSRSAVVFSGCHFEEMAESARAKLEGEQSEARFEECTFSYREKGAKAPKRSLADINESWVPERERGK